MENREREKIKISKENALELVFAVYNESVEIEGNTYIKILEKSIGNRRWSIDKELIIQRVGDGKFFRDVFSVGATESQDESPYEYDEPDFTEVFSESKTITVYV